MNDIFFLLGRGRSGSSLLQTILNVHPSIAIAPDGQFFMFLYQKYAKGEWGKDRVQSFVDDLFLEERMQNWKLDKVQLTENLMKELPNLDYARVSRAVYQNYAHQQGKTGDVVLGDKNNHYSLYIHRILKIYPKAKFIHLVRDARDTVSSFKSVSFDLASSAGLAYRWKAFNKCIHKNLSGIQDQVLFVRFEDVLLKPQEELSKICRFLNVKYQESMIKDFHKNAQWDDVKWRENINQPLNPEKAFTWKKEGNAKENIIVEKICKGLLIDYKYEVTNEGNKAALPLLSYFSISYAWIITQLERCIYYFPLKVVSFIISGYRRRSKTV